MLYLGNQPLEYAPYGCTSTACMCNANYTGQSCTVGVSGYRLDVFDRVYPAICGNDLLPPRGIDIHGSAGSYSSVDSTCLCQQISAASGSDGSFYGRACECEQFLIEGVMVPCAGHGMCVEASFQDGRCADDLSDEVADPLNEPFVPVASAAPVPADPLRPAGVSVPVPDAAAGAPVGPAAATAATKERAGTFGNGPVGAHPLEGRRVTTTHGRLVYDLSEGTFADGRFTVWSTKGGLQGEVTIYGSGRPIVRSERGTLGHSR